MFELKHWTLPIYVQEGLIKSRYGIIHIKGADAKVFEEKSDEDVKGVALCVNRILQNALLQNVKIVFFVNCCPRSDVAVTEKFFQNIKKAFENDNITKIFGGEGNFRNIFGEEGITKVSNGGEIDVIRDTAINFNDFTSNDKIGCHTWWASPLNQKEMEIPEHVEKHRRAVEWFCKAAGTRKESLDGDDDLYVPGNLSESMKRMAGHFGDAHMGGIENLFSSMQSMVSPSADKSSAGARNKDTSTDAPCKDMECDIPSIDDLLDMLKNVGISERTQKALLDLDGADVQAFDVS